MRRTGRPATPHTATDPKPALASRSYDWTRFGRHRLRATAGVLIDSPLPGRNGSWLGTLWPDPQRPGWERMLWEPDSVQSHGWLVPIRLAGGDVIEFGGEQDGQILRWYGIVDSYDAIEWLTIQGPYENPAAAHEDAQRILTHVRYQEPLNAVGSRMPCARTRRPKGH